MIQIEGRKAGELNIIITSRENLLEINQKYLRHNTYTDVITFDYCEGMILAGEIYMSIDDIKENSVIFGSTLEDEIDRVMVHGLLHLLGYKDKSKQERKIMRSLEDKYLSIRMW